MNRGHPLILVHSLPLVRDADPGRSDFGVAELTEQLKPLAVKPHKVALSERQAWSARLDNGITLLIGRDEGVAINDRISRWVAVHPTVQARLNERTEVVDLRYPNGFAVRAPGVLEQEGNERGERSERGSREIARRP